MNFGEKIQKLRNQNKWTQEELAEKLYVSRTAVSKWESGKGYPNIDSLKEIAKIFNITEKIDDNDVFTVYRAFVKTAAGEKLPESHKKKVYLKYLGMPGISWCICEPDGLINILVGRVGEMHEREFKNALLKLKKANPVISDEIPYI